MGTIQSSVGLVTGVAIEDTVNALMKINEAPRGRLESRTAGLKSQQTAITELMTQVISVQLTSDRLGLASLYNSTSVTSSKSDVATARSTGSPKVGNYSFVPVRQAQSQQLTSALYSSANQTLSSGEMVIHRGGFLEGSVDLETLNDGSGVSRGKIRITDRAGTTADIDLTYALSANDVVEAINSNTSLNVVASVDGNKFVLTDVSGSTSNALTVEEVGSGRTALDLGLLGSSSSDTHTGSSVFGLSESTALSSLRDGLGLEIPSGGAVLNVSLHDGTSIDITLDFNSTNSSLGQLIDKINEAGDGILNAKIASDGTSIEIEDLTNGSNQFAISDSKGTLAKQLGLINSTADATIGGVALTSGLGSVLLSTLNGGDGVGELGTVSITDRSGNSASVDLSDAESIQDVINSINASGVGVRAQLNSTKTGLQIVDTTGSTAGNLIIADADASTSATKLKINIDSSENSVDSGTLNRQYIGRNTSLSAFNQGDALALGSIKFSIADGRSATLNLASKKPETVGALIDEINKLGLNLEAKINDTGDGIVIVDQSTGAGSFKIADVGSSETAAFLGIAGTGKTQTVDSQSVNAIDGSQTIRIQTDGETTLAQLVESINGKTGSPVNASLLKVGSSGVRLILTGSKTGADSRVAIQSDFGLNFTETSKARDAVIAFGATDGESGVLVSSATNTFTGLIDDVDINVTGTSSSPVTVSIASNTDNIAKQVETFVTQFNALRDKLNSLTRFDSATNSVGLLFGSNSALRIDISYGKLFSSTIRGAGSINSLAAVGVTLSETGKLEFSKTKFDAAIQSDPAAVKEFFTKAETGFAAKAKSVAEGLAGVKNGALLSRTNAIQSQIEANTKRLTSLDVRLDRQRERLLLQFYNMETTISKLQDNLKALNQMKTIEPFTG